MSVLAINRKESRYEPVIHSIRITDMLNEFAQRNFGIKDIHHFVRTRYAYGKDREEDFGRYRYLLQNHKTNIDMIAKLLTRNLLSAYSIYPTSLAELEQRRSFFNSALGNCNQLIFELQEIVKIFDVDINIYDSYQTVIDREIDLIKKWRQKDNKLKSHFNG